MKTARPNTCLTQPFQGQGAPFSWGSLLRSRIVAAATGLPLSVRPKAGRASVLIADWSKVKICARLPLRQHFQQILLESADAAAPRPSKAGSQSTTQAPPAEAARPLKVKIKFGKRKEAEAEAPSAAQQALQDLERIRNVAYAEALPESLPAQWDMPPPAAHPAQRKAASSPTADREAPPPAVERRPSSETARSSGSAERDLPDGKRSDQPSASPAVAPQAAYLDLFLAMASEDVTMGKSAEAHHSLGRANKHKGDMLREARSEGGGKEVEEALSYAKAGVCFMRHAYMMEGQYTGSASKTVPLMDQNAAWLQRACVDQGSSQDPVRKLVRFLLDRLSAVAQLRAAWVARRSLEEECVRLRTMQHHQRGSVAGGASLTPGHSRPPSPAPAQQRGPLGGPQASGSSSGDKVPRTKLPPGGTGGTHPLAPSPSSNNSTNSAADAQGLGVNPSQGSLSGARGASGGHHQGGARGTGGTVPADKAPPGAMLASRMRGTLQASERLKLSSSQLMAMAASLTDPHGRRAIGALLLVGMDGLGGELRMSVAAAANALDAICSFSKERSA
ncbi:hypothetical protein WJX73_009665 [Symbiochloris irregularis]|uniref:Uncharacterized protein n=1 Tax=Symbiochloris irregularis TaxID=706552 RepID=A0AAW1P2K6_9CHLO